MTEPLTEAQLDYLEAVAMRSAANVLETVGLPVAYADPVTVDVTDHEDKAPSLCVNVWMRRGWTMDAALSAAVLIRRDLSVTDIRFWQPTPNRGTYRLAYHATR